MPDKPLGISESSIPPCSDSESSISSCSDCAREKFGTSIVSIFPKALYMLMNKSIEENFQSPLCCNLLSHREFLLVQAPSDGSPLVILVSCYLEPCYICNEASMLHV